MMMIIHVLGPRSVSPLYLSGFINGFGVLLPFGATAAPLSASRIVELATRHISAVAIPPDGWARAPL